MQIWVRKIQVNMYSEYAILSLKLPRCLQVDKSIVSIQAVYTFFIRAGHEGYKQHVLDRLLDRVNMKEV
jgi:hypothetical protein